MTWAVDHKLPAMQKIVLMMMANRFNEDQGYCWPSYDLLASECGMSRSSVLRKIDELIDLGLVEKFITVQSNGGNCVNKYRLNTHIDGVLKLERLNKSGGVTLTPPSVTLTRGGCHTDTGGVSHRHPKQLYETVKETIKEPVKETINNSVELSSAQEKTPDPVRKIFEVWQSAMDHPKSVLDKKRITAINNALRLGYSVDDLTMAVLGCSKTPHNMGVNERKQRFDGIELIFRSADQIERFIRNFHHPPVAASCPAVRGSNQPKERPQYEYMPSAEKLDAMRTIDGEVLNYAEK